MSELKACPFCKCTEIVAGKDYTRGNYRVDCLGCSAFITAPSLELAIHDWNTRPIEDELRAELEKRTAELHYANTACMEMKHELDRLNAEIKTTDDLLKEATETIGAVVACCTYNSNNDAKIGVYGIDQNAFTKIDQFITRYNDAVSAGKVSVDVKQEAGRKEFCPNCEAETPCTHEAELYVCDICGEDFAKYIVSRKCNVSDVSMTESVLMDIKTGKSVEIEELETVVEHLQIRLSEWRGVARQLADELKEEISSNCTVIWEEVGETSPAWIAYNNLVDTEDYETNPDYYKGV